MAMRSVSQGDSALGSVGVLSDAGGDDTYTLDLSAASTVSRSVSDGCPAPCEIPVAMAVAPPVSGIGQGNGGLGAMGFLEDGAGNDTYRVRLEQAAMAIARDERSQPGQSVIPGGATASGPIFGGQAAGGAGGTGAILDSQGNDRYETTISATAEVRTHAAVPANEPDLQASPGTARALVQGAAVGAGAAGALIDLGGSDAYSASASTASIADGGQLVPGPVVIDAQAAVEEAGAGLGLALDVDGIGSDTYVTVPATPACVGIRGQAAWQDCGRVGIGVNV
jgi:hypothetical protein